MTFRHRKNGQWSFPTLKTRTDGTWKAVSAGGGGELTSPSGWVNTRYLLTGTPPTRSNTAYTSNYVDLQTALNSIGPDTRLVIDNGPLTGNWDLPQTDHITLDGNGTTLTASNINASVLRKPATNSEFNTTTGAAGAYSAGQSSINVNDGSIFSAGDVIRLYNTQDHPDQPFTGSGGDGEQGLYHVVKSVSGNTLTLEENLLLNWGSTTRVDNVNWGAEDIRLTNLTLDGNDVARSGRPGRLLRFYITKEVWIDNCTIKNATNGCWMHMCYQFRLHNSYLDELGVTASDGTRGYPVDFTNGSHHCYITDTESHNSQRYGFKSGSGAGMWPCRNGRIENCHANPDYQRAYDQHQGSHHWEYIDCTAAGGRGFGRDRSDGFFARGGGVQSPRELVFYGRGAAEPRTVVEKHHYVDVANTNHIYKHLDDGDNQDKWVTFRDVWAETSAPISSFFNFSYDVGSPATVHLTIENVALDGTWIESANSASHIDSDPTLDLTINNSTGGKTPSSYFSNKYGWSSGILS